MSAIQDILAIAKRALTDSESVTESDIAPILSDALQRIITTSEQDNETMLGYLKIVVSGIEQIASGVEVSFSFSKDGVIINRKNTLEVLHTMAQAVQNILNIVDEIEESEL